MSFGGSFEKKSGFDKIEKGRYTAILENCTLEATKKTGTEYLQMVFVINDQGTYDGRKIWHKLWFSEKSYDFVSQQLENVWLFDKLPEVPTIEEFKNKVADLIFQLVNKQFEIAVTGHQEYNGKEYPNTFLTGYIDAPNLAIQTQPPEIAPGSQPESSEEIPF